MRDRPVRTLGKPAFVANANAWLHRVDALADAPVLVVMDSRDDVGEHIAQWSVNIRQTRPSARSILPTSRSARWPARTSRVATASLPSETIAARHFAVRGDGAGSQGLWQLGCILVADLEGTVSERRVREGRNTNGRRRTRFVRGGAGGDVCVGCVATGCGT